MELCSSSSSLWRLWAIPFVFEDQSTIPTDSLRVLSFRLEFNSMIVDSITKFVDTTLFLPRLSSSVF
ncbi:unnamed protein product [Arabidopsis lyrata]|uniref:Predicted protein n=1 Tax=Arabidopsis lyrata subsp. lyrata TaxID=81972 RepID=D7MAL0_ARALL|nr:predicted protein [Arabidopsis lyrata subsp. lyrata]CAH8273997.1 unnamed protein product [Arabidopsis lyrata]